MMASFIDQMNAEGHADWVDLPGPAGTGLSDRRKDLPLLETRSSGNADYHRRVGAGQGP